MAHDGSYNTHAEGTTVVLLLLHVPRQQDTMPHKRAKLVRITHIIQCTSGMRNSPKSRKEGFRPHSL